MKSRQLIEALGADDVDPKDVALNTEFDSELFREFMHNYQEECRKLLKPRRPALCTVVKVKAS